MTLQGWTAEAPGVLVGVGSAPGLEASLDLAVAEAVRRRCGVDLVHVRRDPVVLLPASVEQVTAVDLSEHRAATRALTDAAEHVRRRLGGELPVATHLLDGPVAAALVQRSAEAALVVLQRREHAVLTRLVTGSVADAVAARAHAPVALVPPGWRTSAGDQRPLVVGVEADGSGPVVRTALELARASRRAVRVVHVWSYSEAFDDVVLGGDRGTAWSARLREELGGELGPLLREYDDVQVDLVVAHARAADALIALSFHSSGIVVGRHHPRLPLGSHLGPITRAVLHHAVCPVLVVEPERGAVSDARRPAAAGA